MAGFPSVSGASSNHVPSILLIGEINANFFFGGLFRFPSPLGGKGLQKGLSWISGRISHRQRCILKVLFVHFLNSGKLIQFFGLFRFPSFSGQSFEKNVCHGYLAGFPSVSGASSNLFPSFPLIGGN